MRTGFARFVLAAVLLAAAGAGWASAQTGQVAESLANRPTEWDPELVKMFSTLPVQDDGRVKPLSTYANFALTRLNGKRVFRDAQGGTHTPPEWLMDVLFYPEKAQYYKTFQIRNSEVADAIGIVSEGKERSDRYSYKELEPGIDKLFQLATQYSQKEDKDRTSLEQQIVNLAHNVNEFQRLSHFLDFARHDFTVEESPALTQVIPAAKSGEFTTILSKVPTLRNLHAVLSNGGQDIDAQTREKELHALEHVLNDVSQLGGMADALALFPPTGEAHDEREWLTPTAVLAAVVSTNQVPENETKMLAALEKLAVSRDNPEEFKAQLAALRGETIAMASARDEYSKVPLEYFFYFGNKKMWLGLLAVLFPIGLGLAAVMWMKSMTNEKSRVALGVLAALSLAAPFFFRGDYFYHGLVLYILSFVVVALLWVWPRNRFLNIAAPLAIAVPTLLVILGITLRCIIRHRPPVSTLYETILFITAVVVIVSLLIEYMNRQKLALSLASVLGVMGMFLANKYEIKEGIDTMPTLVAVLDTNFWLATHVVTVTMGYAAGLLAGAIAHIYIFGQLFGLKKGDKPFYKTVSRMIYGVLCFGLFFAILGTVLGGIWANDSWGRFWGWDPKENGALMIVLWMLAVLHARMGGYIRDLGVAMAAVFGAMVVAFSWWGVNLLGVGLHSYGFTSGIFKTLMIFYGIEAVVILMGAAVWILNQRPVEEAEPLHVTSKSKPKRA